MDNSMQGGAATIVDVQTTGVSWPAIAAGAVTAAALSLLGAFAAGLAAIEGGQLRDGTWNDRKLTPRTV